LNFEFVALKGCVFADNVALHFNKKVINAEIESFADTESLVKIIPPDLVKDKTIFLVFQFFFFPKNITGGNSVNTQMFQLLLLSDLLKKLGAKKIIGVLPYLPYSRQDKTFDGKIIGSISLVGKLFEQAGIEQIISFDLHDLKVADHFTIKLSEISLVKFWAEFLQSNVLKDSEKYCIVSPDTGRIEKDEQIAKLLNSDSAYIKKTRIGPDQPVALGLYGDVKDKIVIVIDDIVDTAKTAVNACELLLEKGAKKVFGCFCHPVLTQGAFERLQKSNFEKVFITDSVLFEKEILDGSKISVLPVEDVLCGYLEKMKRSPA